MAHKPKVEMPVRPFLYTMDQVATLLQVNVRDLRAKMVWFRGRSTFAKDNHHLQAINIARPDEKPDWRIEERELLRWFGYKGYEVVRPLV